MSEFEHPAYTEGESLLGEGQQERLNEFRRKQLAGEELTDEEREEFLRLQRQESEARKAA